MTELRSHLALRVYRRERWGMDVPLGYTLASASLGIDDAALWYVQHADHELGTEYLPTLIAETIVASVPGLSLAGCRALDAAAWPLVGRARQLERLVLYNTRIDDRGVAQLTGLSNLSELDLSGTAVTDECVESLLSFPRLQALQLSWTSFSDRGLERLAAHESLSHLDLKGTRVTDAGLCSLGGMQRLCALGLQETLVSDRGIDALRARADTIERLELGYTSITNECLPALMQFRRLRWLGLRATGLDRGHDAAILATLRGLQTDTIIGLVR